MSQKLNGALRAVLEGRELIFMKGNVGGCPTTQKFTAYATLTPTFTDGIGGTTEQPVLFVFNPLGSVNGATLFVEMLGGTIVNDAATQEVYGAASNITISSALFIPFQNAQNIKLDPPSTSSNNAPQNFTIGRITTGIYQMQSNQTSTTIAALSGTIAVGILSDLRNMQSAALTGGLVVQNTADKKDAALYIKAATGATTIVGPDIADTYHQLNVQNQRQFQDVSYVAAPLPPTYPYGAAIATGTNVAAAFVLITPYLTATGFTIVSVRPTSPFVPPQLELVLSSTVVAVDPQPVRLMHYYVSATGGSTGTPGTPLDPGIAGTPYTATITRVTDVVKVFSTSILTSAVFPVTQPQENFLVTPPYIQGALYVGTTIALTPTAVGSIALLNVRMHETVNAFTSGPHRIMRCDNLGFAQQLTVKGCLSAEVMPEAGLAAFLKVSQALKVTSSELEELRGTFDDPLSQLKRNYEGDDIELQVEALRKVMKRDRE